MTTFLWGFALPVLPAGGRGGWTGSQSVGVGIHQRCPLHSSTHMMFWSFIVNGPLNAEKTDVILGGWSSERILQLHVCVFLAVKRWLTVTRTTRLLFYVINPPLILCAASPGLQLQFRIDESFLKQGEKRWFLRYLALHTMHIDIWDSDSLLLIGSTAIELKVEDAVRLTAAALVSVGITMMQPDNRHRRSFPLCMRTVRPWPRFTAALSNCQESMQRL